MGAPRALRPRLPFTAGQQPQAQPARARGFFRFPRSSGSGAPGGRGEQRAVAAMPQCRWGGPAAPANGSRRFRGPSALWLPNGRGGNLHTGRKKPSPAASVWKGFVNSERFAGFPELPEFPVSPPLSWN